ncbi:MAG: glycosyltransferase family 4 protein [Bacteroidetes bacterium]|nr:glycosyltransferase family 4 protein [Bacteroidota bacterium]
MNLGFDAKRAFHNASGLGNYSRFVIRTLADNFPESSYLLFNPKASDKWELNTNESIQEVLPPKNTWGSYWRSFQGNKKVNEFKLDVYHGLSNELPFGISSSKVNKVVTIHDLIFKRYPELYQAADRLIYDKKFKHAVNAADTVVAISKTTKLDIINFYGIPEEKIKVVYQGCNPLFYQKSTEESLRQTQEKFKLPANFIICVGTIEARKNGLQILKAIEHSNLDIPIVFVGKTTKYKELLLAEIGTTEKSKNKVIFIESANNEEVNNLYQLALISIYPSIFEGFGIPVLESIATGTPVITNKAGCFKEAGGDAAYYVDPANLEEFGAAIKLLTENTVELQRLKAPAFKHLENFKEAELAQKLMSIYKGV